MEINLTQLRALTAEIAALHDEIVAGHPGRVSLMVGESSTAADLDLEAAISLALRAAFDGEVSVLGEEDVSAGRARPATGPLVAFVDPIDGTRLLREGRLDYGCTFALAASGRPIGGGVYLPNAKGHFICLRGDGLYLDGVIQQHVKSPSQVVAVRPGDLPDGDLFLSKLASAGLQSERLESTSRRMLEVARGEISGLVKHVGVTFGVPRLWGVGAGMIACDCLQRQLWVDPRRRLIAVGAPGFVQTLLDLPGVTFSPMSLDEAWICLC